MIHPTLVRRRFRWVALPLVLVVVLAGMWTAFWFYAASVAEATIGGWREQEGRLGRVYTCASQTVGGYPFRIEVRCANAGLDMRTAQPPIAIRAKNILLVAQIYDPTLLIAEFTGPLLIAEPGQPATLIANWSVAQASVRGRPSSPERVSVVIDGLRFERTRGVGTETVAGADRIELHARLSPASTPDKPVIDLALRLSNATAPGLSSFTAQPLDADISAVAHGLKDLTPRPIAVKLRELQAAGGRLEIQNARVRQGETITVSTGALSLSDRGRLDGTVRVTVAGFERFIAAQGGLTKLFPQASGLDRAAPSLGVLDRFAPGLGTSARNRAETGILSLLGEKTQLEGKPAIAMSLRFVDGAATLGPIPLGQIPPLY